MSSDNLNVTYFVNQAKGKGHVQLGGSLPGFQDARTQKGPGLGSLFRGCYRTALPFTTTLLDTGVNIMNDVAKGTNFRKSLKKRGKRGVKFFNKVKTQIGVGQNQKRTSVIKDSDDSR